jgi:hypothetical protein
VDSKRNEEIIRELQIPRITQFMEQYRRSCNEHVDRKNSDKTAIKYFKLSTKMKKKLGKISEMKVRLCVVVSIAGVIRHNTGKGDDDTSTA